jgi:hypothetical protein
MPDSDELHDDDLFSGDAPLSDEERAEVHRPFFEAMGIEPAFAPEEHAPVIDERRLTAFVRDEVPRGEWHAVWHLVSTYRSWSDAWRRLMHKEIPP